MTNFRPITDRILLRRAPAETMDGKILIPSSVAEKDRPKRGTVIAVGPGTHKDADSPLVPVRVKPGDEVFYPGYVGGTEIELDGEDYVVITDVDVLGVLE